MSPVPLKSEIKINEFEAKLGNGEEDGKSVKNVQFCTFITLIFNYVQHYKVYKKSGIRATFS